MNQPVEFPESRPLRLKLSPAAYALTAFLALPAGVDFIILAALLVAILGLFLAVLLVFASPVFPVAVYFATKKHRQIYGTMTVAPNPLEP